MSELYECSVTDKELEFAEMIAFIYLMASDQYAHTIVAPIKNKIKKKMERVRKDYEHDS